MHHQRDLQQTVGYKTVTKAPGPIDDVCRHDDTACAERSALDLTGMYKPCGNNGDGREECGSAEIHRGGLGCTHKGIQEQSFLSISQGEGEEADEEEEEEEEREQEEEGEEDGEEEESLGKDNAIQFSRPTFKFGSGASNAVGLKKNMTTDDVVTNFKSFLPTGRIKPNRDLVLQASFENRGATKRTVHTSLSLTAIDYSGKPVIYMETRRKRHPARIPLHGDQTLFKSTLVLEPHSSVSWEHTVKEGLHESTLQSLKVSSSEHTLHFHFSASVAETGQVFLHEPKAAFASAKYN